ncbi:MAG: hypothetical protein B0D92_05660 [Spirochaeta sp. LUC14_002_19_P3]|nr:MAG: hypothetical protein B0D92_05660 [Spirochaeta sp. LUC14_002_19_P3]
MKKIIALVLALSAAFAYADYPPDSWTDNILDGIRRAEQENKMLMLNFAGSDWCGWCDKLDEEIFSTPQFMEWSENNLIKVYLDFPQKLQLPEYLKLQNEYTKQFFGVQGFPTIFILDAQLTPLLRTGYKETTPEEYIRHIQNDNNIPLKNPEGFQVEFKKFIEEYIAPLYE